MRLPPFAEFDHAAHHARGDREADAVAAARAREDRRVDADEPAADVDEGAAGIARIDGGVGLDEELVVRDPDLGAGERRDDAVRHRLADAEGVADGEHEIADLQALRVAELERVQRRRAFRLQHREVGARIAEHDCRLELALVGERDLDLGHALDDVVVRHDEPARVDDDAGAERALAAALEAVRRSRAAGAAGAAVAEEAAHELFHRGVLLAALDAGAIDVDDRGRGLLHHRRVGELDLRPALRHGAVLRLRAGGAEERGGKGGGEVQEAHAEGSGTAFADSKTTSGRGTRLYRTANRLEKGRWRARSPGASGPRTMALSKSKGAGRQGPARLSFRMPVAWRPRAVLCAACSPRRRPVRHRSSVAPFGAPMQPHCARLVVAGTA